MEKENWVTEDTSFFLSLFQCRPNIVGYMRLKIKCQINKYINKFVFVSPKDMC